MSETTIRLIQEREGERLEKSISGRITWMELSDEYLRFLTGCGYQVEAYDLVNYFSGLSGE